MLKSPKNEDKLIESICNLLDRISSIIAQRFSPEYKVGVKSADTKVPHS